MNAVGACREGSDYRFLGVDGMGAGEVKVLVRVCGFFVYRCGEGVVAEGDVDVEERNVGSGYVPGKGEGRKSVKV